MAAKATLSEEDVLCCEFFHLCVEKEQAKKLPGKVEGKGTTVRKILKDGLGEAPGVISYCEASVMSKHQDPKTKKITEEKFVTLVLPDLAVFKSKCKSIDEPKAAEELKKMKKKITDKLEQEKKPKEAKNAAVVDRLTDTKKYTGSHGARFGEDGKGKGKEGRVDEVDASGYVGNYKGKDTFGKKGCSDTPKKASAVTDRLTDTSKYGGTHQKRFDESGKGKGLEGRTQGEDENKGKF